MAKKSILDMFSFKNVEKKIKFLTKPNNINKVLILVGVLLALYLLHKHFLSTEGMEVMAENVESELAANDSKKTLVLFHASWCGHCKKLMPTWDQLSSELENNSDVKLIKVECGDAENSEAQKMVVNKYEIQGFPTIKLFENNKLVEEYTGPRTPEAIKEYLAL